MDDKKQVIQYYLFIQHWVIYKSCSCVLCRCNCIVWPMLQLWKRSYLNGFSSDQCQPGSINTLVTMRRHGSSFLFLVPLARFQGPATSFLVSISLYKPCRYIKKLYQMVLWAQLQIHIPSPPPSHQGGRHTIHSEQLPQNRPVLRCGLCSCESPVIRSLALKNLLPTMTYR